MRVITRWPGLVPAIERAGHEPVVVEDEAAAHPMWETGTTFNPADLPDPPVTARPRGAQRFPR